MFQLKESLVVHVIGTVELSPAWAVYVPDAIQQTKARALDESALRKAGYAAVPSS